MSRDPIGNWGDSASLGGGYTYAGNSPKSNGDPLGLYTIVVMVDGEAGFNQDMMDAALSDIAMDPEGGMIVFVGADGEPRGYELPPSEAPWGTLPPDPRGVIAHARRLIPGAGSIRLVLTGHGFNDTKPGWAGWPVMDECGDGHFSIKPAHSLISIARFIGGSTMLDKKLPVQVAFCYSESQSNPGGRFAAHIGLAAGHAVWGYKKKGHLCEGYNCLGGPGLRCPECPSTGREPGGGTARSSLVAGHYTSGGSRGEGCLTARPCSVGG